MRKRAMIARAGFIAILFLLSACGAGISEVNSKSSKSDIDKMDKK